VHGVRGERDDDDSDFDSESEVTVIPNSLCMACGGSGTTKLMLTKIPYFREVIVSSFECDECGERNRECQFGGDIQARGCRYSFLCDDCDRQVIKSETGIVRVPELDLEIPAKTQRGVVTTVEGVLSRAARELGALQSERRAVDPKAAGAIDDVIVRLLALARGDEAFTFEVEDPSGNSFVEGATPTHFDRTPEDNVAIGLTETEVAAVRSGGGAADESEEEGQPSPRSLSSPKPPPPKPPRLSRVEGAEEKFLDEPEVMSFAVACPNCKAMGSEQMCVAKIPHFKECVIMSFVCAACGFKNSEIKAGGAVPKEGVVATLLVVDERDLSRDLLKSETAGLAIPDLELELDRGTLGGLYTSVEGAVTKIKNQLELTDPFSSGDSADDERKRKMRDFLNNLDDLAKGRRFPFTLVLTDPLANSFVGPRRNVTTYDPLGTGTEEEDVPLDDPLLTVERYVRSYEEDDELGLHDIQTDQGNGLPAVAEEEDEEDDAAAREEVVGPDPDMVDHPNPNFARGCDD